MIVKTISTHVRVYPSWNDSQKKIILDVAAGSKFMRTVFLGITRMRCNAKLNYPFVLTARVLA